ncbi:hypothetical protein PVAR5_3432 [Paecilomyces variotii No. 5]|uniref:Major facilitator superfamily (MFS) profile domain-containing protein n=1 Tax=Byssochlamys spectabilis (strain No. 5 / NBRC 109023) TaxID=1356009 RepID=V5FRX9_BYSSN|nr:hypothetical protein PVAR5_3432 [Paecilomyces variotii No. 5]
MVEEHNGRASSDIGTINAEVPSDNSTMTASSIQLGHDQEKTQPLEEQPVEQFAQENQDPEKAEQAPQNATPVPSPPSMPPDGGWEAWLVVLGAFCSLFVSFGWINCIGVFQDYYQTHQLKNLSPSTVAWVPSLETFVMFVGGPIFGKVFDNYGPRWLLLIGTFFHVFGLMMTSLSTKYYQFILAQGICSPLGASAVFYASMTAVVTWFHQRRALALGITASGSSLGGVIFPIMVDHLVQEVDFPWAMRICAFMILGLLVISNLTVRSRLKHVKKPFQPLEFFKPLKELKFVLTVTGAFFFFWGMFLPFTFVILQAERYGMSANMGAYLIPILNAASILGRTLPGYLGDRLGRFNTMIFMTYFSAIVVLAIWLPSRSNAPAIVFSALYGFGSGAFVSLGPAVIAQISDVREIGIRNGTFFALISIAALTGNPIGGALAPNVISGSFTKLQIFCGVVQLAGATFFVIARVYIGGPKLNKRL